MAVIDSYASSNATSFSALSSGFQPGHAQSFTGDGSAAIACSFYLARTGTLSGNVTVSIYAHSGTFGSSSVPTGSPIATSDAIAASSISTTLGMVRFTFSTPPTLTAGTKYVVVIEFAGGDTSNYVSVSTDASSPTHAGNPSLKISGVWTDLTYFDFIFEVENATEIPVAVSGPWYNSSWIYRVKVTVDNTKVDADLTDFPVYVDLANLPSYFHTYCNQTDARDIRVTTSDKTTEVPREVVFYNSTSNTGELHFKAPALANASNTDFYIYFNNSAATEPSAGSTYGKNNVWDSSYKAVYHLGDGSTLGLGDSTTNANTLTNNSVTATTGKVGGGGNFSSAYLTKSVSGGSSLDITGSAITIEAWVYPTTSGVYQLVLGNVVSTSIRQYAFYLSGAGLNQIYWALGGINTAGANVTLSSSWVTNAWNHIALVYNGSTIKIYLNGAEVYSASQTGSIVTQSGTFDIGFERGANYNLSGKEDEVKVSTAARAAGWLSTQYNNHNASSTFYAVGGTEYPLPNPTFPPRPNTNQAVRRAAFY